MGWDGKGARNLASPPMQSSCCSSLSLVGVLFPGWRLYQVKDQSSRSRCGILNSYLCHSLRMRKSNTELFHSFAQFESLLFFVLSFFLHFYSLKKNTKTECKKTLLKGSYFQISSKMFEEVCNKCYYYYFCIDLTYWYTHPTNFDLDCRTKPLNGHVC